MIGREMRPSSDNGFNQILSYRRLSKCHLLTQICLNIMLLILISSALVWLARIKVHSSYNLVKPDLLCPEYVTLALPKNVTASYCENDQLSDITFTYRNLSTVLSPFEIQTLALKLSSDIFVPLSERFIVENNSVIIDEKFHLSPSTLSENDVNEFVDIIKLLARLK